MSKNFELLQHISNEKELFQTLEDWDETSEKEGPEPRLEVHEAEQEHASGRTSLPDVFQTVSATLGPLDPLNGNSSFGPKAEDGQGTQGSRFPIGRNPFTPLNSTAVWLEPEAGNDAGSNLERGTGQSILSPEELEPATTNDTAGFARPKVQDWPPPREEKTYHEASRPAQAPSSARPAGSWRDASSFGSQGRAGGVKRVQPRGGYRNAKREAIAREEEFKLVQRIFLESGASSARVALFSGVDRDGGCAAICVRAGEILAAQAEGSVCLVDANFRTPSLHEYFGLQNINGLAEATIEGGPIHEFAQHLSPANLWLIPSGSDTSRASTPRVADQLRARIEELRDAYRYVVIYSGPLWLNAGAMMLSKWTDGVVLVLEANSTRRDAARRIKESLAVSRTKVLGVVLNNRTYPIPEELYNRL